MFHGVNSLCHIANRFALLPSVTFGDFDQLAIFVFEFLFGACLGVASLGLYKLNSRPRGRILARAVWVFGGFLAYADILDLIGRGSIVVFSVEGLGPFLVLATLLWMLAEWVDSYVTALVVVSIPGLLIGAIAASFTYGAYASGSNSPNVLGGIAVVLITIGFIWGLMAFPVFGYIRANFDDFAPWVGACSATLVCAPAVYQLTAIYLGSMHPAAPGLIAGFTSIPLLIGLRYAAELSG